LIILVLYVDWGYPYPLASNFYSASSKKLTPYIFSTHVL